MEERHRCGPGGESLGYLLCLLAATALPAASQLVLNPRFSGVRGLRPRLGPRTAAMQQPLPSRHRSAYPRRFGKEDRPSLTPGFFFRNAVRLSPYAVAKRPVLTVQCGPDRGDGDNAGPLRDRAVDKAFLRQTRPAEVRHVNDQAWA